MRPITLGNMVLHRLGAPNIHWHHFFPRHANAHIVVILLRRRRRRIRFGSPDHRFLGGLVITSSSRRGDRRRVAPVALLRYAERDRLWIAAAVAAAWGPGRGLGHERLSPPCSAGLGGSPIACDLACHKRNTRCSRTDGSALLSSQRSWHSGFCRVYQQHCPAAWSSQQPPI